MAMPNDLIRQSATGQPPPGGPDARAGQERLISSDNNLATFLVSKEWINQATLWSGSFVLLLVQCAKVTEEARKATQHGSQL